MIDALGIPESTAKIGGMDRQTLRDWVIRFNEQGADGVINIPSPGMPPKLNAIHTAFLARIVEEGLRSSGSRYRTIRSIVPSRPWASRM